MKRVLLLICICGLLFFPNRTTATLRPVQMQVDVIAGENLQVSITSAKWLKGQLRILPGSVYLWDDIVLPVKPIEVPAGETKVFHLLVPDHDKYTFDWEVRLEQDGKVLAKRTIAFEKLDDEKLDVGMLTDQHGGHEAIVSVLAGLNLNQTISVYPLLAKNVPETGGHLSGFDVLILGPLSHRSLSPVQAKAVQEWVADGGKLLITGGNDWKWLNQTFGELLPVQLQGTTQIQLPSSMNVYVDVPKEPIQVIDSRIKKGSSVLHKEQDHVLVASTDFFRGKVYFLAFDLTTAPMKQWQGNQWLLKDLLAEDEDKHHSNYPSNLDYLFDSLKPADDQRLQPNFFFLLFLLVIYFLLVGPVLFRILYWKKKPEWAWLGVPLCAIVFSLVIVIYGYWVRGEVVVSNSGYVLSHPNGWAKVEGKSHFYSLNSGNYAIRFPKTFALPIGKLDSVEYLMDHQQDTYLMLQQMPQWSVQSITMDSLQFIGGSLQARITKKNGKIHAEIVNQTRYPIQDLKLVHKRHYIRIGNLKPKESKKITTTERSFYGNNRIYLPNEKLWDDYADRFYLFGWIKQPLIKVQLAGYQAKEINWFMIVGSVE